MGVERETESASSISLRLFEVRDHEVILDSDLAALYEILRAFVRNRDENESSLLHITRGVLTDADRLDLLELELFDEDPETVTYFVQSGTDGPIKIGVTTDFESRFRSLQMSSPEPLRVLGVVHENIEDECHLMLATWRLHGEWFKPTREVLEFLRERLQPAPALN